MNYGLCGSSAWCLAANMLAAGMAVGGTAADNDMPPIRIVGPWRIEVGPGSGTYAGKTVSVPKAAAFEVAPVAPVTVTGEQHPKLPVFNPKAGGWRRGVALARLRTQECTATGLLDPASVRVMGGKDAAGPVYRRGVDYDLDDSWATLGRLEKGGIGPAQAVRVDYVFTPCRLDAVFLMPDGAFRYVSGTPGMGAMLPPPTPDGAIRIAHIWLPGVVSHLTEENLYPVNPHFLAPIPPAKPAAAERLLPKTMEKIRKGQPLTILAWGDSVTAGGGLGNQARDQWYQNVFARRLAERFPHASIRLISAAWPGGNSHGWLAAPPGGTYDFKRDVLDRKPDVVTIEFVNDAGLSEAQTLTWYRHLLDLLEGVGAEVILITPHYVRPDWMHVDTLKVTDDPRPYVHGLRRFARENHVALADASKRWGRLWEQGIPYTTLLANSINHPDARGHALFADALMALFPPE